jgi:transposase
MYYMGIDHHMQYSQITVLEENGKKVKSGRVWNTQKEVEEFLMGLEGEIEGVVEAGRSQYTMVELMESLGVKMKIANPLLIKAIAKAKIKTDKRDSLTLAHLLRMNYIPEVFRRSHENRQAQRVLRHRVFYVQMRTRIKNRIRVLLAQQREDVRQMVAMENNLFKTRGIKMLHQLDLPGEDQKMLESMLETLKHTEDKIKHSDALVKKIYNESEPARLISTVPGFGDFFSVLVATEISDIKRFSNPAKLHSYAGVIPSIHSSGGKTYYGPLVQQGNKWLRWAAVEAVMPATKSDFDIHLYSQRLARKKGANTAKVAAARRLLTIIYRVLKEKRAYVPYKRKKQTAAFRHA